MNVSATSNRLSVKFITMCCVLYIVHLRTLCSADCHIVTCVGRSRALPVPLLPLLYEACGVANIKCSITKLLNDDVILALGGQYMTYGNSGCCLETHKSRIELQMHIIYYVVHVFVNLNVVNCTCMCPIQSCVA